MVQLKWLLLAIVLISFFSCTEEENCWTCQKISIGCIMLEDPEILDEVILCDESEVQEQQQSQNSDTMGITASEVWICHEN